MVTVPGISSAQRFVADRERPAEFSGLRLTWLETADLDRSTPYRGIAVVNRTAAGALARSGIGVYRPVGGRVLATIR